MDERTGSDIEVWHRLQWVADARAGKLDHVSPTELEKYLVRLSLRDPLWNRLGQSLTFLPRAYIFNKWEVTLEFDHRNAE